MKAEIVVGNHRIKAPNGPTSNSDDRMVERSPRAQFIHGESDITTFEKEFSVSQQAAIDNLALTNGPSGLIDYYCFYVHDLPVVAIERWPCAPIVCLFVTIALWFMLKVVGSYYA